MTDTGPIFTLGELHKAIADQTYERQMARFARPVPVIVISRRVHMFSLDFWRRKPGDRISVGWTGIVTHYREVPFFDGAKIPAGWTIVSVPGHSAGMRR